MFLYSYVINILRIGEYKINRIFIFLNLFVFNIMDCRYYGIWIFKLIIYFLSLFFNILNFWKIDFFFGIMEFKIIRFYCRCNLINLLGI